MSVLAAKADGNLTAAATWALVDPTSFVDLPLTTPTNLTPGSNGSFLNMGNSFTPGAITIDGIALGIVQPALTLTGTLSIRLHDGTNPVAGTTVIINGTDLPTYNKLTVAGPACWVFFKFAAPVTLPASAVSIQAAASGGSGVGYVQGTSATVACRALRTTTAQAPAAADLLFVFGEHTGAGAVTPRAVTMNDAAAGATVYGQVTVADSGTLAYGISGSVNYHLKLAGNVNVWAGGTLNLGTAASPMPSTSTAVLEFNCASNVQYGLELLVGSTCNMRGATKTVKAFLAADAAAGAVGLTTDVSTGWKSGDEIGIASTTRSTSDCEKRTLSADAVTTTLSVPALTNAHGGVAPVRAEVINLTRNVKVRGASGTLQAYVNIAATAVYDWQYAELYWLGSSTAGKRGVDAATTTGSGNVQFCAIHDFITLSGVAFNGAGATFNNVTFSNNVIYNILSVGVTIPATSGTNIVVDSNVAILSISNASFFNIADVGITFTNNTAVSSGGPGFTISEAAIITGTFSGNLAHSNGGNGGVGFAFTSLIGGTLSNFTAWRNNGHGFQPTTTSNLVFDTFTAFGNNSAGMLQNGNCINCTLKNPNFYSGTTLLQTAVLFNFGNTYGLAVDGGSLGSGGNHSSGDFVITAGNYVTAVFNNVLFASSTEVSGATGLAAGSRIGSQRHDQTAGNHRTWLREGTVIIDTTIADASPSERLTPALATEKLKSGRMRVAVLNGQTVTFTVKVRKSAAGDGTAYNGSQPRLMLEKNVAAGVAADTVLATAAAAAGAWETLTATTPAAQGNTVFTFFVDCDGTTGWVNVDTAGAS